MRLLVRTRQVRWRPWRRRSVRHAWRNFRAVAGDRRRRWHLLTPVFPGSPAGTVVLLGMVAYFTGVVRAPLTAVIILSEATASRGLIVPLFVTALIAHSVSALVCKQRLYHGLARPWRSALGTPARK